MMTVRMMVMMMMMKMGVYGMTVSWVAPGKTAPTHSHSNLTTKTAAIKEKRKHH